jgi:hypothetical protein
MALPELPRARGRERVVPTWELVFGTLTQVLSLLLNLPGLLGIVDCARYVREETCGLVVAHEPEPAAAGFKRFTLGETDQSHRVDRMPQQARGAC